MKKFKLSTKIIVKDYNKLGRFIVPDGLWFYADTTWLQLFSGIAYHIRNNKCDFICIKNGQINYV